MSAITWYIAVGALLVLMAVSRSLLRRLPLSTAIVYLCAGFLLDPAGFAWLVRDPAASAGLLERLRLR